MKKNPPPSIQFTTRNCTNYIDKQTAQPLRLKLSGLSFTKVTVVMLLCGHHDVESDLGHTEVEKIARKNGGGVTEIGSNSRSKH